ncbi:MAG TPA: helix-turn-helix domain-containing protein [Solirubrobacterales bacterium]
MGVIGDTLAEARTRRAVDLEEVHSATGIRPRYLRAIEQEDWDALPEEFYARSFIRKYAQFLDVDPEPLVEEYRRRRGGGDRGEAPTSPFARTTSRKAEALRRRRRRQGIYAWVGAAAVAVAIVVVVVLLVSGGGGGTQEGQNAAGNANGKAGAKGAGKGGANGAAAGAKNGAAGAGAGAKAARGVALRIEPTAEVWACVLDAKGKPLVDGLTLAAGETMGPFHARSYTAAFGNGSVHLSVNGAVAHTPSTPSPIGIAVDAHGKVHEIPEGERPSCE